MFATLTSKGQVTLPKAIRERLGLDAGSTLDFQLQGDDTITVRAVKADAMRLRGLLRSAAGSTQTEAEIDAAVTRDLLQKFAPPARKGAVRVR